MASSGKRKTTGLKLAREARLRERRATKQMRRDARKQAAAHGPLDESTPPDAEIDGTEVEAAGEQGDPALAESPLADA